MFPKNYHFGSVQLMYVHLKLSVRELCIIVPGVGWVLLLQAEMGVHAV